MSVRESVQEALEAGRPERAWELCAERWQRGDTRARHDARRLLNALAPTLPPAAWTQEREALARELGLQPAPAVAAVGQISFPVVSGQQSRFITAIVARSEGADDVPPGVDPSVHEALEAAREGGRHFSLRFVPREVEWKGASCGLAVALAARSFVRGLPISPLHSATGGVDRQGRVLPVGSIDEKLRLRHEARPWGRLLIPAVEDRQRDPVYVLPVGDLDQAWQALGHAADRDPERLVKEVHATHRDDPSGAARLALDLVDDPDLSDTERLFLNLVLLAAANHEADTVAQARWSVSLETQVRAGADGVELARAVGSLAVRAIDALDPVAARRALDLAQGRVADTQRVHLDGPGALLATLEGRFDDALDLRRRNLAQAAPEEKPRCQGDLADALRRLGRLDEALEAVDEALSQRPRRAQAYIARSRPYLHLHRARILAEQGGHWREGLAQAKAAPGLDPALRARLLRAELTNDRAAIEREPDWGILAALKQRARAVLGDEDARRWLLQRLGGADWQEAARRLPY